MSYKTYERYNKSTINWVEQIPNEWDTRSLGSLFYFGRGRVISNEEIAENQGEFPVYSSQTKNNGVLGYINTYDFEGEYVTWTTDGANAGTVFYREGKFNCTNVCGTIKPKEDKIYLKFLPYFLNLATKEYVRQDINPKLMNDVMSSIRVCFPIKRNEQIKIVNFLDKKTSEIDNNISKNKELISLLEEKKVALINQCVTKGLNPNVPMKDSGIEWIGEIPEHWDLTKIKNYFIIKNGSTPSNDETNWGGEICWITPADYKTEDIYINKSSRSITQKGYYSCGTNLVKKGSIIVSNRAPIGSVAIANIDLCTNQGCKSLVQKNKVNSKFIYYLLSISSKELNKLGRGTTFMELSSYDLGMFEITYPPIHEQNNIVEYLDLKLNKLDKIIEKVQSQIDLLEEYKQSLIHHTVTGKIDVREVEV